MIEDSSRNNSRGAILSDAVRRALRTFRLHWTRRTAGGVTLVLICAVAYLPGWLALPPIDRDEARFAEASRRMVVAEGWQEWVVPVIQDRPRLNKPPLIYWMQAGCVRGASWWLGHDVGIAAEAGPAVPAPSMPAVGESLPAGGIWAYRIPSMVGATLAVLFVWRLGVAMYGGPVGWLAGVLLALCMVVMHDVRQARTDQVLLAWTTLAQWALWQSWSRTQRGRPVRWRWLLCLWMAVGLGVLTKGPVTPAVVALTALVLSWMSKRWRWLWSLRPVLGVGIVLAMVAPWLILVGRAVGWGTFGQTVYDEILGRSMSGMEGHWGPPGYHLALLPVLFWPGSLTLGPALIRAWRLAFQFGRPAWQVTSDKTWANLPRRAWRAWGRRIPGRRPELFCLAWLIPGWVVFELVATKLPHYVLPMYPALALLGARSLYAVHTEWMPFLRSRVGPIALWGWVVLTEVMILAIPAGAAVSGRLTTHWPIVVGVVVLLLVGQALMIAVVQRLRQGRFLRAQWLTCVTAIVVSVAVFELILPHLRTIWLSSRIMAKVSVIDPAGDRPIAGGTYREDSLVFLTQGRLVRSGRYRIADWIRENPQGLAIVSQNQLFVNLPLTEHATVEGFNYADGQWQDLAIVTSAQARGTSTRPGS